MEGEGVKITERWLVEAQTCCFRAALASSPCSERFSSPSPFFRNVFDSGRREQAPLILFSPKLVEPIGVMVLTPDAYMGAGQ